MKRACLVVVTIAIISIVSSTCQASSALVDEKCSYFDELILVGLIPPEIALSRVVTHLLCSADEWSTGAGVGGIPPVPPPLPAPGSGSLHLVTQQLTKAVTQTASGEVISLGSLTITETQDTTGYTLDVAFALSSSPDMSVTACTQAASGVQPWQVEYPSAVGSGPFDYPTSGSFLQQLAADGYIDTTAVDMSGVPDASEPTDLWTQQPTFGQVLGPAAPPVLAGALVPGALYVNLVLTASAGAPQWEVQEWNYAFSIHAHLAGICGPPTGGPPPVPQPGPAPHPRPGPPAAPPSCQSSTGAPPVPASATDHCVPAPQCPTPMQTQPGGACARQGSPDAPTCMSGPRAGKAPPPGADFSSWCETQPPTTSSGIPCAAPDACPAVLTCGGGISCPLLPPS